MVSAALAAFVLKWVSAYTFLLQLMLCLHMIMVALYGISALPKLFVDTLGASDRYSLKNSAVFVQPKVLALNIVSEYALTVYTWRVQGMEVKLAVLKLFCC